MGQMGQMGIWEAHMSLQARSNVSNGSNSPPDTCGGPLVLALREITEKRFFQKRVTKGDKWDKWASWTPICPICLSANGTNSPPPEGHMALPKRGIWPSEKGFVGWLLDPYETFFLDRSKKPDGPKSEQFYLSYKNPEPARKIKSPVSGG